MLSDQRALTIIRSEQQDDDDDQVRDIHALTPPHPQRANNWETRSRSSTSTEGGGLSESNFGTMSREFNALVLAGSTIANNGSMDVDGGGGGGVGGGGNLGRIGEEMEEMNRLAIVPDNMNAMDPVASPHRGNSGRVVGAAGTRNEITTHQVKKEEIESKISAWQTAKIAKINNRFKREDAVIQGWEGEEVQKATSWMKKVERKLEEKRAKALEKMQNDVAKARRKAEEKRASAEARRGTKVARVLEIANLMRTLGRPPTKRSFF